MPFRKRPPGHCLRNVFDSNQSVSSPCRSRLEQVGLTDRRRLLAQILSGNLDVAGLGQLPATQLRDHLKPGPLEMERASALAVEGSEDAVANQCPFVGPEDHA
jgi:hypothetical protein